MAIELNGNTKIAVRIAEVISIFGALIWFGWQAQKLSSVIEKTSVEMQSHCRTDWTLQHEVLRSARIMANNPESKFTWPNVVDIHNDIRRSQE